MSLLFDMPGPDTQHNYSQVFWRFSQSGPLSTNCVLGESYPLALVGTSFVLGPIAEAGEFSTRHKAPVACDAYRINSPTGPPGLSGVLSDGVRRAVYSARGAYSRVVS